MPPGDSRLSAWTAVAIMMAGLCGAVGWTTQKITRASAEVRAITDRAASTQLDLRRAEAERDRARDEAESAKLAQAEASGRLAAYIEQAALQAQHRQPATRPSTNMLDRLADVLVGDR